MEDGVWMVYQDGMKPTFLEPKMQLKDASHVECRTEERDGGLFRRCRSGAGPMQEICSSAEDGIFQEVRRSLPSGVGAAIGKENHGPQVRPPVPPDDGRKALALAGCFDTFPLAPTKRPRGTAETEPRGEWGVQPIPGAVSHFQYDCPEEPQPTPNISLITWSSLFSLIADWEHITGPSGGRREKTRHLAGPSANPAFRHPHRYLSSGSIRPHLLNFSPPLTAPMPIRANMPVPGFHFFNGSHERPHNWLHGDETNQAICYPPDVIQGLEIHLQILVLWDASGPCYWFSLCYRFSLASSSPDLSEPECGFKSHFSYFSENSRVDGLA
ncbi:uncharacterized protein CLUP02_10154 [Colletotrichum lupini]|uniref:Uncharacterized protein n=1 Tax=Colletotrichum lupini TaxID=145971 RepID=A0A9Q8SWA7_9PEZI|nr:uncharacterized protein CLUP02_10154 [Colletotrichum lupini]UQC84658.1 hypothetical protein CLUP02_10154 [Colletotrichum lupini]